MSLVYLKFAFNLHLNRKLAGFWEHVPVVCVIYVCDNANNRQLNMRRA